LARAVRARRADLPIVIMTGYSDVSGIDAQLPYAELLKKPFRHQRSGIERRAGFARRPGDARGKRRAAAPRPPTSGQSG